MQEVVGNTYSDWLQIASEVKANGLNEKNYDILKAAAPLDLTLEWSELLLIQAEDLLRQLLNDSFHRMEKKLNQALQCNDVWLADRELLNFRKKIKQCFFYMDYSCLSGSMKQKLNRDIYENVKLYQIEIIRYLKNVAMDYPEHFTEEILYLVQKRSFYGYVKEQMKI